MSMIGVSIESSATDKRKFLFSRAATTWADEIGPQILAKLRQEAPVSANGPDSGRLKDSLNYSRKLTSTSTLLLMFDSRDVPYFPYVIHGTSGGQVIVPVAARALHWSSGGSDVFAKSVTRGDTPANDFPTRVWDSMKRVTEVRFAEIIKKEMGL